MRLFVTVFVGFVLMTPQIGLGGPVGNAVIRLRLEDPIDFAFGTAGAEMVLGIVDEFVVNTKPVPIVGGHLTFRSDTLLSLFVYEEDGVTKSLYHFGPGTAQIEASWFDSHGVHKGRWDGELLGVSVFMNFENSTSSSGEVWTTFGRGTFDRALAIVLGVTPQTVWGEINRMFLFDVSGDPSSPRRLGDAWDGIGDLIGADLPPPSPVPEPGTMGLALMGAVTASLMGISRLRRKKALAELAEPR